MAYVCLLGGDDNLCAALVNAYGWCGRYVGGDGLRKTFYKSRCRYRRAVQRKFAQGRAYRRGDKDLAGLGAEACRGGRDGYAEKMASDRLGQSELAYARDFLLAYA